MKEALASNDVVIARKYLAELLDREREGKAARVVVRRLGASGNEISVSIEAPAQEPVRKREFARLAS